MLDLKKIEPQARGWAIDPADGNAKLFHDGAVAVMSAAGIKPAAEPTGVWDGQKSATNFEQALTSLGGKVDKVTPPIRRRLAYEIGKYRDGQYGVLEYSLPPEQAREFERTIKLTEDILRHIVIRRDE